MSTWPPIAAGQSITAGLLTSMLVEEIVKQGDTDRASTTTQLIDPELQMAMVANAVYHVEFFIYAGASTAGDFQTTWQVPSGATGLKNVHGPGSGATANSSADNQTARLGVHGFGTNCLYNGSRNGTALYVRVYESGIVTTAGSAGTCGLLWAQGTSDATATRVAAGSIMRVKRIG